MLSINPSLTHDEVLNCLQSTGVEIDQNIGNRIDADAALECVQASLTGDPIPWFNTSELNIYDFSFKYFHTSGYIIIQSILVI